MPEDDRHNWANWWGILRLWDIHRGFNRNFSPTKRWPDKLDATLKILRNFEALFLYGHNETAVQKDLLQWKSEKENIESHLHLLTEKKQVFVNFIVYLESQVKLHEIQINQHFRALESLRDIKSGENRMFISTLIDKILPAEAYESCFLI
ncbi:MAG: hypothetical protein IPK08_19755 [Bacteroidetes bacterium]|nr:hypothetical protein [Bacteroidota bacterium]